MFKIPNRLWLVIHRTGKKKTRSVNSLGNVCDIVCRSHKPAVVRDRQGSHNYSDIRDGRLQKDREYSLNQLGGSV